MGITALQHCTLIVQDMAATRLFYTEALGMAEVARPSSFDFDGAWFRTAAAEIHVIAAADTRSPAGGIDPGPAGYRGRAFHIAFEVDNLAAMQERLTSYNVPIVGGPQDRGDGVTQLYLFDPDRYLIELFERP